MESQKQRKSLDPERDGRRAKGRVQHRAWVELLNRYQWHHFATLTFTDAQRPAAAWWIFRAFIRRLERFGNVVWWAAAAEAGPLGSRVHFHVLLGGTDHLEPKTIQRAWKAGSISRVEVFESGSGGTSYLTKRVQNGDADLEVSGKFDRKIKRWERVRATNEEQLGGGDA